MYPLQKAATITCACVVCGALPSFQQLFSAITLSLDLRAHSRHAAALEALALDSGPHISTFHLNSTRSSETKPTKTPAMRFYYLALVFTAALLSASGAQPLTSEQNQVPALIEPKAARFDGAISRSLRTADTTDEDDEERAILDKVTEAVHRLRFKVALKRAKTPEAKDLVQFAEWVRQKRDLNDVAKILGVSNTITGKGAAYNKYKAFESFWLKHRQGNNIGINFHVTPKNA